MLAGIANPTADSAPVFLFLKMRSREALKVIETAANLIYKCPSEYALFLHISGSIGGELHDFDSSTRKPPYGIAGKEQEACVLRYLVVVDLRSDTHAPIYLSSFRFVEQTALHVAQVFSNFDLAEILNLCVQSTAIIPRHAGRLLNQSP